MCAHDCPAWFGSVHYDKDRVTVLWGVDGWGVQALQEEEAEAASPLATVLEPKDIEPINDKVDAGAWEPNMYHRELTCYGTNSGGVIFRLWYRYPCPNKIANQSFSVTATHRLLKEKFNFPQNYWKNLSFSDRSSATLYSISNVRPPEQTQGYPRQRLEK
eukprot:821683-Amphidinium_carterae.1